jgi:dipeptidyl aminopeptidase/acylaminoacyl peptidase
MGVPVLLASVAVVLVSGAGASRRSDWTEGVGVAIAAPTRPPLRDSRFGLAFLRGYPVASDVIVADLRRGARRVIVHPGARIEDINWARRGATLLLETTRSPFRFELMPDGTVQPRENDRRCLSSPDAAADGTRLECFGTSATLRRPGADPLELVETQGDNVFSGHWTLSPDGMFYADVEMAEVEPAPYVVNIVPTRSRRGGASTSAPSEFWEKSDLSWSPDGRRLAFSARRESDLVPSDPDYDPFHNRAREAVIVVRADGRVLARIPNAARPAWSPDGGQLAFDSNRSGRRRIYVADVNGRHARQVTHGPRASWRPRWRRLH